MSHWLLDCATSRAEPGPANKIESVAPVVPMKTLQVLVRRLMLFEDAAQDACMIVAVEDVPGPGPHDGKRLNRRERRTLRGIEEASIREQVSQP